MCIACIMKNISATQNLYGFETIHYDCSMRLFEIETVPSSNICKVFKLIRKRLVCLFKLW